MFASRKACSRCAARLLTESRTAPGRPRHQHVASLATSAGTSAATCAATESSTSQSVEAEDPQQQTDRNHRGRLTQGHGHGHGHGRAQGRGRARAQAQAQAQAQEQAQAQAQEEQTQPPPDDPAVALFNGIVSPTKEPTASVPGLSTRVEWELHGKLKELFKTDMPPLQTIQTLNTDIWPHLAPLGAGRIPKHLFLLSGQVLAKASEAMIETGTTKSSAQLASLYDRIGMYDLSRRNRIILNICYQLITDAQASSREKEEMLQELVDVWGQTLRHWRSGRPEDSLQSILPSKEHIINLIKRNQPKGNPGKGMHPVRILLKDIFVRNPLEGTKTFASALLATAAVFSDADPQVKPILQELSPLVDLLGIALMHPGNREASIAFLFRERAFFPEDKLNALKAYISKRWYNLSGHVGNSVEDRRRGSLSNLHKRLRSAHKARNLEEMKDIWEEFTYSLNAGQELREQITSQPEHLDYWIFVWCSTRQRGLFQEALSVMGELGVQPTLKTYTSMMHGWKFCKDGQSIRMLWEKLVSSGVQLDAAIWTERISGLIDVGRPQEGVQALAEMLAAWKTALQNGRTQEAVQPTIEMINAACKGILPVDKKAADQILDWAGREGIHPNIYTYNIYLRNAFQNNDVKDVHTILSGMKEQGVEPDAATFTIIIEEVLGGTASATAAEQVHAIDQILQDIETAGLSPNQETFGKMLYAVCTIANAADDAIAAVLNHMRQRGLSATPHMVTILIERALRMDPSSIANVQSLLKEHGFSTVTDGDQTLWERVCSGYAVAGHVDDALRIFRDLLDHNRPVVSLNCLAELVKALLRAGRFEEAREVVKVVLEHKTKEGERAQKRYWRHHLWHVAKENGLLHGLEFPPAPHQPAQ